MRPLLAAVAVVLAISLAGCGGKDGTPTGGAPTGPLDPTRGAIAGLVIDDVYRPVPGALVLLQPVGLTATSDRSGQFAFTDLEPGAYVLKVQADGHAAAPKTVEVVAGQYAEAELQADRLFNQGSRIVTTEFSAFIPCAADFVVNGVVANCLLDLSGDSYRAGFTSNVTELGLTNITYMVNEVLLNQQGNWILQVREDDGSAAGGERYAVQSVQDGRYIKVVNQHGVRNTASDEQARNVPWTGDKPFATIIFFTGEFKEELSPAGQPFEDANVTNPATGNPVRPICCGVGASFGIQAKFVQSIFLGAPTVDIASYSTLKPS
ncbi:MAG TPA: carboxypeptidase-like regulatory domain-containing protein [Candidatus Thermoplasmatota archaeon]|nr:carboxypeptidase-like regulatory domain-containing protein [Candidatus Thermoplasmatota archaeon]